MIDLHVLPTKLLSHTDTNETLRTKRSVGDIHIKESQNRVVVVDVVDWIKHSLLRNVLGEDGGLGDVEVKSSILIEDMFEFC
jgi:hypothetical protein